MASPSVVLAYIYQQIMNPYNQENGLSVIIPGLAIKPAKAISEQLGYN